MDEPILMPNGKVDAELARLTTMIHILIANGFEVTLTPQAAEDRGLSVATGLSITAKCAESGGYLSDSQLNKVAELVDATVAEATEAGRA